ncbi:MAG: hypothetical protein M5T52_24070 [Ignavibacteriaceae bacterium]|nr:hypothetical protein [Ignavibacteriaceae bacterium]
MKTEQPILITSIEAKVAFAKIFLSVLMLLYVATVLKHSVYAMLKPI